MKYLNSDEAIKAFLDDAFESGSADVFHEAIHAAARACGAGDLNEALHPVP
jgi:DNA-binding phage protein